MTQTQTAYRDNAYRCFTTEDGIHRRLVGCQHETPRSAIAHVANLDPFVSPLRSPMPDVQPSEVPLTAPVAHRTPASGLARRGNPRTVSATE